MGDLIDLLMWLQKRIEEKGCAVGKVYPLTRSFLVSISSRMLVWLSRPIHLLSVHVSRFDMLTPYRPDGNFLCFTVQNISTVSVWEVVVLVSFANEPMAM